MRWVKMVLLLLALLALFPFLAQNKEEVVLKYSISYYGWNYGWEMPPVPLFLVILGSVILGVMIGGLLDVVKRMQLKMTVRQQKRTIERLEKEAETLRVPVPDGPPAPTVKEGGAP